MFIYLCIDVTEHGAALRASRARRPSRPPRPPGSAPQPGDLTKEAHMGENLLLFIHLVYY